VNFALFSRVLCAFSVAFLILLQEIISMGANSAWDDELDFIFVQEVEMGETPLRNSQLQAVIGAGMLPD